MAEESGGKGKGFLQGSVTIPGTKKKVPVIAIVGLGGGAMLLYFLSRGKSDQPAAVAEPDSLAPVQTGTGGGGGSGGDNAPDVEGIINPLRQQYESLIDSVIRGSQGLTVPDMVLPSYEPGPAEVSAPPSFELDASPAFGAFTPVALSDVGSLGVTPRGGGAISAGIVALGPAAEYVSPNRDNTVSGSRELGIVRNVINRATETDPAPAPSPGVSATGQGGRASEAERAPVVSSPSPTVSQTGVGTRSNETARAPAVSVSPQTSSTGNINVRPANQARREDDNSRAGSGNSGGRSNDSGRASSGSGNTGGRSNSSGRASSGGSGGRAV